MRNGTTTTYTYDNNNRLISEVSSSQVKSYTYDANGNQLTAISNGNYAGAYTYDLWNMQATYTVDSTEITSYTYRPTTLCRARYIYGDTQNLICIVQKLFIIIFKFKEKNKCQ